MNKVVLITGGTSGYGLATAKKFKENGDKVIIASIDKDKVESVVGEFGFDSGFVIDVTNYERWLELKNFVLEKYGKIDVLVNNAGSGVSIVNTTEQTRENIDKIISVNLNSVIYGSSVFGKVMQDQGDGVIVNISSVCAKHSWDGWSVYAAAKAGVLNFTKGLYVELQPYGVRATCVIPAAASTGFQKSSGIGAVEQSLNVQDIANAVYYVATQPKGVVVEEITVWGTSQVVNPL